MGRERHVTFYGNFILYLIRGKSGAGRNSSTNADLVDGSIGCPVGELIAWIWKQNIDDAAGKAESICLGYIQLVVVGLVNIIVNAIIHKRNLVVFSHGSIISRIKFNSIRSRFRKRRHRHQRQHHTQREQGCQQLGPHGSCFHWFAPFCGCCRNKNSSVF